MQSRQMRLIDRGLGPPLCWFATRLRGRAASAPPETVHEILLVKMLGMGSLILMSPMVRALRGRYPRARLTLVTLEENEPICRSYGIADELVTIRRGTFPVFAWDSLRFGVRSRGRYDIGIDAEFLARYTNLLLFLSRTRFHIGFASPSMYRGRLPDHGSPYDPDRHITRVFLDLVRVLGIGESDLSLERPRIPEAARESVRELLLGQGVDPRAPLVLINPNTSDTSFSVERGWPVDRFVRLGAHCFGQGASVAFIGDRSQAHRTETIASLARGECGARGQGGGPVSLAGRLEIPMLLAAVERSSLLITNDSGPLHIAASLGRPTFSFFGTETPRLYAPRGSEHVVFYKGLPCSPCLSVFNYKQGRCDRQSACLGEISFEEVATAFDRWWEASFPRRPAAGAGSIAHPGAGWAGAPGLLLSGKSAGD